LKAKLFQGGKPGFRRLGTPESFFGQIGLGVAFKNLYGSFHFLYYKNNIIPVKMKRCGLPALENVTEKNNIVYIKAYILYSIFIFIGAFTG
jgi:hypothetical protein